ncbi:MAG: hypothetical protein AAB404_02495 [Patescibacteria group bacterium]
MIIRETDDFLKESKELPLEIRKLFQKQKSLFNKNWLDIRLHTKRIKEMPGVFLLESPAVTERFFYFRNVDEAVFFSIGHRKDIYQ